MTAIAIFMWSEVYEGQWKASQRHGYGIQTYGAGKDVVSVYAGNWLENRRHGKGTMTYASGNTYEGDWRKVCSQNLPS